MSLNINADILNKAMKDDLKSLLTQIIDIQLAKPYSEMDCDLIDECTDMLIELEQEEDDGFAVLVPMISSDKIMSMCASPSRGLKHLSRGARVIVAACIILFSTMTVNATVKQFFDYDIAKEVSKAISTKLEDWGIIAGANENEVEVDFIPQTTTVPTATTAVSEEKEETAQSAIKTNLAKAAAASPAAVQVNESKSGGIEINDGGDFDDETTKPKPTLPTTTQRQGIEINDGGEFDDEPTTEPTTELTTEEYVASHRYEHRLFLDANGGDCETAYIVVIEGKAIGKLPTPTREGYVFNGWYNEDLKYKTSLFGNKKTPLALTADTYYMLGDDAVATAQWLKIFDIELDANGGECEVDKITTYETQYYHSMLPIPTREDYVFDGWYTYPEGGTKIVSGASATLGTTKLYAHWIENSFTVTLDANGGECGIQSLSVKNGEVMTQLPTPAKDGYIFVGWFDGTDSTSAKYTDESVYNKKEDCTLYAVWSTAQYTVTLDPAGGECSADSFTAYYQCYIGDMPIPVRTGYDFAGWYYYYKEGAAVELTRSDKYTYTTDITLKAFWDLADYTLTLDPNGGDIANKKYQYTYNYMSTIRKLPDAYRGGGYEFAGWFTEPEGGEQVKLGDPYCYGRDITLYAHWNEVNEEFCTVTAHTGTNDLKEFSVTVEKGGTLRLSDIKLDSTKYYYGMFPVVEFTGWYDDEYYGDKLDDEIVVEEDMDIYAHWEVIDSKLVFTNNHPVYNVGEEFDYNAVDIKMYGVTAGFVMFSNMRTDLFGGHEEEWQECFWDIDTSEVGVHTYRFRYSLYVAEFGLVCIEGTDQYTVTDCEHNGESYIINEKTPTCANAGYSGDIICSECGAYIEKGEVLEPLEHGETVVKHKVEPTDGCPGYTGDVYCAYCGKLLEEGEAPGEHTADAETVLNNYIEPTCESTGYTGDVVCANCGAVLEEGHTLDKTEHSIIRYGAKEPTCCEDGCTGYLLCEYCEFIVEENEIIPAYGHDENTVTRIEGAYEPTQCYDGYTGDTVCAECGKILEKGEIIPALGHDETTPTVIDGAYEPTQCYDGFTGYTVCAVCGEVLEDGEDIPALGHDETTPTVNKRASKPTCIENGYTGDVCCAECGVKLADGERIPALGHDENTETVIKNAKEPTCIENGYTGDVCCAYCKLKLADGETIPALGHDENTETVIKAKEPTCKETGNTGDVCCAYCGEVLEKGEEIPALGHDNEDVTALRVSTVKEATCGEDGYTGDIVCRYCGEVLVPGEVIPAFGHDENTPTVVKNAREASCKTTGYSGDICCADCGEVLEEGHLIIVPHDPDEIKVTPASFTSNGKEQSVCKVCGSTVYSRTIYKIDSVKLDKETYAYTGSQVIPGVIALDSKGNEITAYELSFSENPVEEGTYDVTVTFTGDYTGSTVLQMKIARQLDSTAPVITGTAKVPNGFSVTWEADETQFDGYEIKIVNNDITLKTVTVTNSSTKTKSITGKSYPSTSIIKMRGYKNVTEDGVTTKVYSGWSNEYNLP